ncbi:hypothetical protein [Curtobacterium sp. MCBA15_001]|uniref:hypothetical protein n=1 Tax=Curtobacterium sp. MCBA15_001 TaxID=1898731 RepID=UPI0008DC70AF|nr:hypothetical protein [Curtobacterium sp. MCBA15_001]OIH95102.1 hypothetical protein BIU90_02895 [Curtobacterium sp. MCBA15_001]
MTGTTELVTDADLLSARTDAEVAQSLLRFAERQVELTTLTLERRTHVMTITHSIDVAPASLNRIAKKLRRNLEATLDAHESARAGLDSEGKAAEVAAVLEDARSSALGIRTGITHEIREAERLGLAAGIDFDDARKPVEATIDRILAVQTFDDADALVASLSE